MKACPCCNSIEIQTYCKKVQGQPVEIKGMRYWRVECLDCGMRTRDCFDSDAKFIGFKDGKEEAIFLWDTRKTTESVIEADAESRGDVIMGCYCCKNSDAQWSMKYDKILCQTCWETLESIELFRDKIMELAEEKYNKLVQKYK